MPTEAERGRLIRRAIADDPVTFTHNVLRFHAWSKQQQIIRSTFVNKRTAVRSCHGSGKTATAARVALAFLAAYRSSRVITTAPTFEGVRSLLWPEIHAGVRAAPRGLYPPSDLTRLQISEDWWALGLSTNEPERFSGHHAEHLLLIVDEASGVSEDIFTASEGFMTAAGGRVLLIGNPTQISGQFFRAFHSERDLWETIAISAFDTPNLTGEWVPDAVARKLISSEWVEERGKAWGVDSPTYAIRVLGEFPTQADDQVMGLAQVEAAQARQVEPRPPIKVSCDVARFGTDETVIMIRRGQQVRLHAAYVGVDTMQTAGRIIDALRVAGDGATAVVDDSGVGGGVTDRLREQGVRVEAFNGAERANDPDLYPNRRSEAWWATAEQIDTIDLDADRQLAADLVAPRYSFDSKGRRVVESKDMTKRRLGRSPDRADAVLMAFAPVPRTGATVGPDIMSGEWD